MTPKSARRLAQYNAWANKTMFDAVAKLPPGEAVRERKSLFKNMVHMLNHIYVIERIWQAHLEGRPHGYSARNTPDHPPLEELWRVQQEVDAWYVEYAAGLTAAALEEEVDFELIGGQRGRMSRGDILLHVVTHGNYHRGYVAEMMYQVPARPPVMDLPVFLREATPA